MKTNVRIGLCTLCLAIPVVLNYNLLWRHIYLELNIVAIVSFLFSGFFILGCCTAIIMFHITSEDGLLDQILHLRGRIKTRKKLWPEQNNHSIKLNKGVRGGMVSLEKFAYGRGIWLIAVGLIYGLISYFVGPFYSTMYDYMLAIVAISLGLILIWGSPILGEKKD